MATQAQIQKALQAGYSQAQIDQYLSKKNPKKTVGGFIQNIGRSGEKLVGDTASAIFNPIDTAKNVVGLGASIISNVLPGQQGNEQLARDVGKFYVDRYGGLDKAWNTFYNDPVGMAADISTVLGGAGALAKLGKVGKVADTLSDISRATDPFRVPGRVIGSAGEGLSRLGVKAPDVRGAIKEFGDTYSIKSTRIPTSKQNKLAQKLSRMNTRFGSTPESLIETTGLYGQDVNAISDYIAPLEEARTKAIRGSGITVQNADVLRNFSEEIAKLSTPEALRDPATRLLREKLLQEARAYAENNPVRRGKMSLESLDKTRARIDKNTPNAQFESDKAAFQRSLGNVYRGTVNNAAGTGEVGKELSILYDFKDAVEKAPKGKNTLPMGIVGTVATGTGFLSGSNPASRLLNAGLSYGATQVANSPKFIGNVSKFAKKASNVQTPQIAKNVINRIPSSVRQTAPKVPGALYTQSRVNRMIPQQQQPTVVPSSNRPMAEKKPRFTVEQFKQPKKQKNVFNNAAFGGTFTLKRGNFS